MTEFRAGHLFVFEGGECSGKTTTINGLASRLISEGHEVLAVREPGGNPCAEQIRSLIMGCDGISPLAEAMLFVAARAEFTEKTLLPALRAGKIVLLDRYYFSTLAYQGILKCLGADTMYNLNYPVIKDIKVDSWIFSISRPMRHPDV